MKTIEICLFVSQEKFLRSFIRQEIFRKYVFLDTYRSEGIDISSIRDDIFQLKSLYRQLTGQPFKI